MAVATIEDCEAAYVVLRRFLQALRDGDDATVAELLLPPVAVRLGAMAGAGMAQRFLDVWALPEGWLPDLTPTRTARVLPPEQPGDVELVAFRMVRASPIDVVRGAGFADRQPAYLLALIDLGRGWRVWGTPDHAMFRAAQEVDLGFPA